MVVRLCKDLGWQHEAYIKKTMHNEYNRAQSRYRDLSVSDCLAILRSILFQFDYFHTLLKEKISKREAGQGSIGDNDSPRSPALKGQRPSDLKNKDEMSNTLSNFTSRQNSLMQNYKSLQDSLGANGLDHSPSNVHFNS